MIKGSHVTSSYTSGLTCHLQTHPVSFQEYIDQLKNTMTPDNKSKFEHFQARNNQYSVGTRTVDSDKRFHECNRNSCLNPKKTLKFFATKWITGIKMRQNRNIPCF